MDDPHEEAGVLLLSGGDAAGVRAAHQQWVSQARVAVERLDLAEGGVGRLIDAVRSPDLFSEHRALDVVGGEELNAEAARRLAAAMEGSDARVVIRAGGSKPHRAVVDALSKVGSHRHLAAPSKREIPRRIQQMAEQAALELDSAGRRVLAERSGHDLERAAAVLDMLSRAGMPRPQARQIDVLLGSSAAPGVPWEVTGAVEAGDAAAALEAVEGVDPQAVLVFLARRLVELGRLAEAGVVDAEGAQQLLGGPRWRAGKAVEPARRLGDRAAEALGEVVDTTVATRSSSAHAEQRVAALVVRLAQVFEASQQE